MCGDTCLCGYLGMKYMLIMGSKKHANLKSPMSRVLGANSVLYVCLGE